MAFLLLVPITTLSGYRKSLIASPSLKNSGLETTSMNFFFFKLTKIFSILSPVLMGTVDFVTIILYFFIIFFKLLATWKTYFKSAELLFVFVGVPTQIKIISELITAFFRSVVKINLFCLKFFFNISSNPGSKIGTLPAFKDLVDAKVEIVMCAYNRLNDEPCCGSELLLNNLLRENWNFNGHVVSDCGAIYDIKSNHKFSNFYFYLSF